MRLGGPPLTCQEVVELITAYLENGLSRRDRRRFEAHISKCDGCTNYVQQMRQTIRLAGRITPESLSPQAREELLRAFRDWRTGQPA